MSDLPTPDPLPSPAPSAYRPTEADLVEVLTGLAPGWYTARQLLPRFNVWAKRKGKAEITAKTMGECLQRAAQLPRRKVHGNISAYEVTPESIAHRDWFRA